MPSDAPDPLSAARDWVRAGAGQLRRRLAQRGPAGRLLLLGLVLAAILAAGYLAGRPERATETTPIFDGYAFTREEAGRVARELMAKSIAARVVRGRVEVPRDRLVEAHAALKKLGIGPASIPDIAAEPVTFGLLSSPSQIEYEHLRRRERLIEAAIRRLDEQLSAYVQIRNAPPRGLAPKGSLNVTVFLEVEDDHPLPPSLIERIERVVRSLEPELMPETGLWICDSRGNPHRMPGAPALEQQSRQRARADQLRADIEHQLTWIPGVRVAVRLEDIEAESDPAPMAAIPVAPAPPPSAIVSVNQPPEEIAAPPAAILSPTPPPAPTPSADRKSRAFVAVWVPGEYYRKQALALHMPSPTPADLAPLAGRTEGLIRKAVEMVVSSSALGELTVERIPATGPEDTPAPAATPPMRGRWPGTAGTAALGGILMGLLGLIVAAGAWYRSAARSARRPSIPPPRRPRIDMYGLAPAERARELVRLDPAAAGGVLQRWIGQGGPGA